MNEISESVETRVDNNEYESQVMKEDIKAEILVFRPTEEEFAQGPIKYVANIRSQFENAGICRIIPPQSYRPPFAINESQLHFKPRRQNLSSFTLSSQDFVNVPSKTQFTDLNTHLLENQGNDENIVDVKEVTYFVDGQCTLKNFSKFGDALKSELYGKTCDSVSTIETEKTFWSLIECKKNLSVYLDDQPVSSLGSGFIACDQRNLANDRLAYYALNHWNLLNINQSNLNVFRYCDPWQRPFESQIHIGMCLTSHSWRAEPHWTYSLNYLHWGDTKIWYAVSPTDYEKFEAHLESFDPSEDTENSNLKNFILDPKTLTNLGIKATRIEQEAGDYIVTLPKTYHMEIDCGVNFGESINYASINWLMLDRPVAPLTGKFCQSPMFSHSELVCRMALEADSLDISLARVLINEMNSILKTETQTHEEIKRKLGDIREQREAFELVPLIQRQCDFCRSVIFLSAIRCCCGYRYVCFKHCDEFCTNCERQSWIFRYRYTLHELQSMVHDIRCRIENYELWLSNVEHILKNNNNGAVKHSLKYIRNLLREAKSDQYDRTCNEYRELRAIFTDVKTLTDAAKELLELQAKHDEENLKRIKLEATTAVSTSARIKKKMQENEVKNSIDEQMNGGQSKTRCTFRWVSNDEIDRSEKKLRVQELHVLCDEIAQYPIQCDELDSLKELLFKSEKIETDLRRFLRSIDVDDDEKTDGENFTAKMMEDLINDANSLVFMDFGRELDLISCKLNELYWIEQCQPYVERLLDDTKIVKPISIDLNSVKSLIERATSLEMPSMKVDNILAEFNLIVSHADLWLTKAQNFLTAGNAKNGDEITYEQLRELLDEYDSDKYLRHVDLNPSLTQMRELSENYCRWKDEVDRILHRIRDKSCTDKPYMQKLDELIAEGRQFGLKCDDISTIQGYLNMALMWREKLEKLFVRKNPIYSLLQILSPRSSHSLPSTIDLLTVSSRTLYLALKKTSANWLNKETMNLKKSWFEKQLGGDFSANKISDVFTSAVLNEESCVNSIAERNSRRNQDMLKYEATILSSAAQSGEENDEIGNATGGKLNRERDRLLKRFCICGKASIECMTQCQLCFDWFHAACVQNYLPSSSLVKNSGNGNRGKQAINEASKDQQKNFLCPLCCRGKRPSLLAAQELLRSLQRLPVRLLEGELLQRTVDRAHSVRDRINQELTNSEELKKCFEHAKDDSDLIMTSHDTDGEKNFANQSRKVKNVCFADDRNDETMVRNERNRSALYSLLCQCNSLEISINESPIIWNMWVLFNPSLASLVSVHSIQDFFALLSNQLFINFEDRYDSSNDDNDSMDIVKNFDSHEVNETMPSKRLLLEPLSTGFGGNDARSGKRRKREKAVFTSKNMKRKSKRAKLKSDETDEDEPVAAELCSSKEKCLKPNGKEVHWVFCEGKCQGWFHQLCLGIESPQDIIHIEKYYCRNCVVKDTGDENSHSVNCNTNIEETTAKIVEVEIEMEIEEPVVEESLELVQEEHEDRETLIVEKVEGENIVKKIVDDEIVKEDKMEPDQIVEDAEIKAEENAESQEVEVIEAQTEEKHELKEEIHNSNEKEFEAAEENPLERIVGESLAVDEKLAEEKPELEPTDDGEDKFTFTQFQATDSSQEKSIACEDVEDSASRQDEKIIGEVLEKMETQVVESITNEKPESPKILSGQVSETEFVPQIDEKLILPVISIEEGCRTEDNFQEISVDEHQEEKIQLVTQDALKVEPDFTPKEIVKTDIETDKSDAVDQPT